MANVITTLSKNMPARARAMIIVTIVGVISLIVITISRLSGPDTVATEGMASIDNGPSVQDISKDTPLDEVIFSENTEVGRLYRDNEEEAAKEALEGNSGMSHLDVLRLNLDSERNRDMQKPAVPDVVDEQPMTELQRIVEERRKAREQQEVVVAQTGQQVMAQPPVILASPYQNFIEEERKAARDRAGAYGMEIQKLIADKASLATPAYDGSGDNDSGVSTPGRVPGSTGNASGYEQYLTGSPAPSTRPSPTAPRRGPIVDIDLPPGVTLEEDDYEVAGSQRMEYPSERLASQVVGKKPGNININTGELFYGVLQIGVNTDEPSPVRAVIVEKGPLEGSVLVAREATRSGEVAIITFDAISVGGKSHSMTAVALDPDTMRSGLADSVDKHTFERYTKLFMAAFIDGYASSMTGGQTITNTDGSTSTIVDALPSASDQALVGLGKVGETFVPIFEREFDRPPTVRVENNRPILLMFMSPLEIE